MLRSKTFASVSANFETDHEEPEVSNKSAHKEEVKANAGLINTQPSLREHAVPVPGKSFSSQDSLENYDIGGNAYPETSKILRFVLRCFTENRIKMFY